MTRPYSDVAETHRSDRLKHSSDKSRYSVIALSSRQLLFCHSRCNLSPQSGMRQYSHSILTISYYVTRTETISCPVNGIQINFAWVLF